MSAPSAVATSRTRSDGHPLRTWRRVPAAGALRVRNSRVQAAWSCSGRSQNRGMVVASNTCRLTISTPEPANQPMVCSTARAVSAVPSRGTRTRCSPAGGGSRGSGGTTTTGLAAEVATARAVLPAGRRPAGWPRVPSTARATSALPRAATIASAGVPVASRSSMPPASFLRTSLSVTSVRTAGPGQTPPAAKDLRPYRTGPR
jgi:hypothetical protein